MYKQQRSSKSDIWHYLPLSLLSALAICLLTLSACSPFATAQKPVSTPTATPIPMPAISATLRNQGDMQLQAFQQWIDLMKQYSGNVTSYQQQYNADQQALQNATTSAEYQTALHTLNGHVASIKIPAMKTEAQNLLQKLEQGVTAYGQKHQYYDSYNNTTYPLGYEYGSNGIGGNLWVEGDMASAKTMADYQQIIEDLNMYQFNFKEMVANSNDRTPYNQPHKTDLQLMQHYNKTNGKVIVVSLEEQALRAYDNGQLVKAFYVTTGRPELPTPPGVWWVEGKQSPTVFKTNAPKNSPEWYPPTPINYAMQYHSNGYYLHDSWWRVEYGPGTNFPHADVSGDVFSDQGSHGCVNMSKADAGWVYGFVQLYTPIIIY